MAEFMSCSCPYPRSPFHCHHHSLHCNAMRHDAMHPINEPYTINHHSSVLNTHSKPCTPLLPNHQCSTSPDCRNQRLQPYETRLPSAHSILEQNSKPHLVSPDTCTCTTPFECSLAWLALTPPKSMAVSSLHDKVQQSTVSGWLVGPCQHGRYEKALLVSMVAQRVTKYIVCTVSI